MAELLLRVADKVNEDFYLDTKCTKRGDVIAVCPDGWNWGTEELTAPFWRIVKIPALSMAEAESFLLSEEDLNPESVSKTLQRRAAKLDLDDPSLPAAFKDFIADDTRKSSAFTLKESTGEIADAKIEAVLKASDFMARKIVKAPILDPLELRP